MGVTMKQIIIFLSVLWLFATNAEAHEPVFGLGPHTLYQYGYAFSSEFERGDQGWVHQFETIYGVTPDLSVTAVLPYVLGTQQQSGWGDAVLRMKYRFYRFDMRGASRQAAVHAGVKLPTGNEAAGVGSGFRTVFVGLSYGYESRRHYFFAGARYRINGKRDSFKAGNVLAYNIAYGIRPWKLEYNQPDPVFILEVNGRIIGSSSRDGQPIQESGGRVVSVGPALLFSYRNVMFKAGWSIPVYKRRNGKSFEVEEEILLALEWHLPPFK